MGENEKGDEIEKDKKSRDWEKLREAHCLWKNVFIYSL